MNATATAKCVHDFERAGLGKAPFRVIGVGDKVGPIRFERDGVTVEVGAPGQPMGVCAYCGTGIRECWTIRSADGKTFDVGCDCVARAGDAGMKRVVNKIKAEANRKKRKAKAAADAAYLDSVLADSNAMRRLKEIPHTRAASNDFFRNATALDELCYMRNASGAAGLGRTAKWVRQLLA